MKTTPSMFVAYKVTFCHGLYYCFNKYFGGGFLKDDGYRSCIAANKTQKTPSKIIVSTLDTIILKSLQHKGRQSLKYDHI